MDVWLPDRDGLSLARQLKADPATRKIVIVAYTAGAGKEDELRALAAGCDGYISKPVKNEVLISRLAYYLAPKAQPTALLA